MVFAVYAVVIFVSTLLGAFVGLGGGVVIKPVLDALSFHSLQQIAFYSSCAVFVMSLVSTAKHIKNKTPIDSKIVLLFALGSVFGGFCGNRIFNLALSESSEPDLVRGVQSVILCAMLILVVISVNINVKKLKIKSPVAIVLSGFLLGLAAAFLGIGGGPINVAVITLLFSFSMRDAAVYSVAVVFFSQLSNLITMYSDTRFEGFDLKYLAVIIPFAVLGGLFGARLNRKCGEKTVRAVFTVTVSAVSLLAAYNAVNSFVQ